MSIHLSYIDNNKGIYVSLEGEVTLNDFISAASDAYSEEHIQDQKYQIIDFTNCSSFNLSTNDMLEIAKIDKKASIKNPSIRIAIIAPNDLTFGMSRVYEAYADDTGFDIKVFRNSNDAKLWIEKN